MENDNVSVVVAFDHPLDTRTFENVHHFDVRDDGTLIIVSREYGLIACFSPGFWSNVEMVTPLRGVNKEIRKEWDARHSEPKWEEAWKFEVGDIVENLELSGCGSTRCGKIVSRFGNNNLIVMIDSNGKETLASELHLIRIVPASSLKPSTGGK